jgi:hypothetical protein
VSGVILMVERSIREVPFPLVDVHFDAAATVLNPQPQPRK